MAVVRIREMRMTVRHGVVPVRMGVARAGWYRRLVDVIVMRVAHAVHMLVRVRHGLVRMPVSVPLGQV